MKKYTISVQNGLKDITNRLIAEGHKVISYEEAGLKADIVIITGVDSEYEEIETAQCRIKDGTEELLLINASRLSPDDVIKYIDSNNCNL